MELKIAIDGIAASHPQPGGYRTYTINLIKQLADLGADISFTLFVDRPFQFDLPSNWRVEIISAKIPWVGVAFREQCLLPLQVWKVQSDLFHAPCATGPLLNMCPGVVTLLDTIEFSTPLPNFRKTRFWAMRIYSRLIQARMARKAEKIITISHYSKERIAERFKVPEDRIAVTYLGVDRTLFSPTQGNNRNPALKEYGVKHYVLAFASASPRKNIDRLIMAYASVDQLLREDFPLVLVCTHSVLKERLARKVVELDIQSTVFFLNKVSDNELAYLYGSASLFVFPSLEEGFGLPPLEAMACGTPVVASDTSSLPEVLGDAAVFVPPDDIQAIAEGMSRVLTSPSLVKELRESGLRRSRMFSWIRTARDTLDVYREVMSGRQ